jgi:hypothetical protein
MLIFYLRRHKYKGDFLNFSLIDAFALYIYIRFKMKTWRT